MKKENAGVYPAAKKDGSIYYRASLTHKRKHISLGSFETAEDAHRAYNQARLVLRDASCGVLNYRSSSLLPFEKWVSLINFRDNGLYISNPIYIMRRMFHYYLSPDEILKFDAEELFFYSSHKIMRRGSHYFVADYGSQINIANRYGIRSHAVEGRDYFFLNGDVLDFRSANLKIVNRYVGVTKEVHRGKTVYRCRIHIRGNFIVGDYASEEEAAAAYNKAADLLKQKGLKREFARNYIEKLSKEEYEALYASVRISQKIRELSF
ncbi:MAG: hypothetical protein K6E50_10155 [Lachnospiraceae bacterium]|nr:hypothetical protein [Lachnospiraceae bacterium]